MSYQQFIPTYSSIKLLSNGNQFKKKEYNIASKALSDLTQNEEFISFAEVPDSVFYGTVTTAKTCPVELVETLFKSYAVATGLSYFDDDAWVMKTKNGFRFCVNNLEDSDDC